MDVTDENTVASTFEEVQKAYGKARRQVWQQVCAAEAYHALQVAWTFLSPTPGISISPQLWIALWSNGRKWCIVC